MSPLVARTLRELRLDQELSLRELAERCGLNKAIISQIERGRLVANDMESKALGRALGVQLVTRTMLVVEENVSEDDRG